MPIKKLPQWFMCMLLGGVLTLQAQEWPRFRGPNGTGISEAKSIPVKWTESDFNWKLELPGSGHSSPVLWEDKIFLTCTKGKEGDIIVVCISAVEGKILWSKDFQLPSYRQHRYNSFASSSVAVDKDHIFLPRITPDSFMIIALDHTGSKVWERDLGTFKSQHGGGGSPMLYDGKVIVGNEQMGESSIVALDAKTGNTVWQTPRESGKTAYGTPCIFESDTGTQLLFTSQASGIYALNPDSGKVQWSYPEAFDKRSASCPVVASGLVLGTCGSGGGGNYVVAVKPPTEKGGKPKLVYKVRRSAPYVPTSVTHGNLVFLWSDGGIVTCVHAPTGETKWRERVGGTFFGSPVRVNDKLYCISTTGDVIVLEASDTFKLIAKNPLEELSHATPAVADGRMYLRTLKHLYSIGGSSK